MESFKPKPNHIVSIRFEDTGPIIIIGPIINRCCMCWSYYQVFIDQDKSNLGDIKMKLESMDHHDIKYNEAKKILKILYVSELSDHRRSLTDDDMLDDLDEMKNEIVRRQISMNILKQQNNIELYEKNHRLIYHEPHKLFHLPSYEAYTHYLDKIDALISKQNHENQIDELLHDHMYDLINGSPDLWKSESETESEEADTETETETETEEEDIEIETDTETKNKSSNVSLQKN
jgi:hypothetical protein